MKVCADCFVDKELKNFINTQGQEGVCDCLHKTAAVIDTKELEDFFVDLLNLYEPNKDGISMADRLFADTHVFAQEKIVWEIMQNTIEQLSLDQKLTAKVSLKEEITNYDCSWDELKTEVLTKYRYFSRLKDSLLKDFSGMEETVPKDTLLYRARITPDDRDKWTTDDLWCPPPASAKAGRANPVGIPYLYLCKDDQTPLYETRTSLQDRVTIGVFKVLEPLKLINLSAPVSLYWLSQDQNLVLAMQKKIFFDKVGEDMSKPKRSIDSEIEYIPTQLVCEYYKHSGYDGISFNSSLNRSGVNIVLFAKDKLTCERTYSKTVTQIAIQSKCI